jgi:hypothetical protein
MKTLALLLCIVVPAIVSTQRQDAASPSLPNAVYFPAGVFGTSTNTLRERWYSQTLAAMGEPSLFILRADKSIQVYRFLWLPSFHRPISVRLTINSDGSGTVVARSVDRHMGLLTKPRSDTGKLIVDTSGKATSADVANVMKQLDSVKFWSMTTKESPEGFQGVDAGQPGYTQVPLPKLDGAGWLLEGLRQGEYHVVDRRSPEKDSYSQLCRYLLGLGKVNAALY